MGVDEIILVTVASFPITLLEHTWSLKSKWLYIITIISLVMLKYA